MPWNSLANNQTVSFANLADAVATNVFNQKQAVPSTSEQITKQDAQNYVDIDTSFASFAAKTSNQLVVKSNLISSSPTPTPTNTPTQTNTPTPTQTSTQTPTPTSTSVAASPTPTPTPTSACYCYFVDIDINQNDIDAAFGNTGSLAQYNGLVIFDYTDCSGASQRLTFETAQIYYDYVCVCSFIQPFYYANNLSQNGFSSASQAGSCNT